MSTYAIMVRDVGGQHEYELCRVRSNPEAIVRGAEKKVRSVHDEDGRIKKLPVYEHVYFREVQ